MSQSRPSDESARGASAIAAIDGGSRGNPGPAGYGVHIETSDGGVIQLKQALGICTNNVAEYRALLAALRWAVDNGVTSLHILSDSALVVCQMRGDYRVRNRRLLPLYEEAQTLARRIGLVTFEYIPRELNYTAAWRGRPSTKRLERSAGRRKRFPACSSAFRIAGDFSPSPGGHDCRRPTNGPP